MTSDVDIDKVKRNVATMMQKRAPESDIDGYIKQSGTTIDAVKNYKPKTTGLMDDARSGLEKIGSIWPESVTPTDIALIPAAIGGEGLAYKGAEALTGMATRAMPRVAQAVAETPEISGAVNLSKAAGSGAAGWGATGAASGAVNAPAGKRVEGAIEGGKEGAKIGAEIGTGGAVAAKALPALAKGAAQVGKAAKEDAGLIKSGWNARDDAALDAARDSMESKANISAKALRKSGVTLKPEIGQALMKHIDNEIKESDFGELHPKLHGETMGILDEMRATAPKGMTISQFDNYRKMLRQVANAGGEDGKLAREVMDTMRQASQTLVSKSAAGKGSEAINHLYNYVDNWAKAQRFDTLSSIVKDAKGDPNKIQTGFKTLLKNDRKMRGFNAEEKAAIKRASENATSQSLLTLASKFGVNISKGVSGNTLPFAGALTAKVLGAGRPLEAGAVAGGTVAGYGKKLMARGAAENALSAIEKRPTGLTANQALGSETDPLVKRIAQ